MEKLIIKSFNEVNETEFKTLEELKEFSDYEILDSYLRYEGVIGYTRRILGIMEILNKRLK